jgi:hypothetical protein
VTAESIRLGDMNAPAQPWLRTADWPDQDHLRTWRNAHTQRFFYQSPITSAGQRQWFEEYRNRPDDFLFMVMQAEQAIGCIGIRLRSGVWDLYTVIRGIRSSSSAGFMAAGLRLVVDFARDVRPVAVRADVISDNPARSWYLRNGFVVVAENEKSCQLHYQEPAGPTPGTTA